MHNDRNQENMDLIRCEKLTLNSPNREIYIIRPHSHSHTEHGIHSARVLLTLINLLFNLMDGKNSVEQTSIVIQVISFSWAKAYLLSYLRHDKTYTNISIQKALTNKRSKFLYIYIFFRQLCFVFRLFFLLS